MAAAAVSAEESALCALDWRLPTALRPAELRRPTALYNLALERGHTICLTAGAATTTAGAAAAATAAVAGGPASAHWRAVTLAHGVRAHPLLTHPFWGTVRCLTPLAARADWPNCRLSAADARALEAVAASEV